MSKVASRGVVQLAGVVLMVIGLVVKVSVFAFLLPDPVLGCLFIVTYG